MPDYAVWQIVMLVTYEIAELVFFSKKKRGEGMGKGMDGWMDEGGLGGWIDGLIDY